MKEWFFQQTATGATYLQVITILALMLFVAGPLAYVTIRDFARTFRELNEERKQDDFDIRKERGD